MAQIKKKRWLERAFSGTSCGGLRAGAGIALICLAVAMAGLGVVGAGKSESLMIEKQGSATSVSATSGKKGSEEDAAPEVLVVDVGGAVAEPKVVRLESGARVDDAIQAAGGLAEDADTATINRAMKVEDGSKVYVPRRGESASGDAASSGTAESGASSNSGAAGTASTASTGLVNINAAGLDELDTLPGVGPATAQAIIDDRTQNGSFSSIEDLMRVSGIGEKKFANMKDGITV